MNSILPVLLAFGIPIAVVFFGFFVRFTGLTRGHAALVWFGSFIAGAAIAGYRMAQMEELLRHARGRQEMEYMIMFACQFLLVPACALLGAKLYHKWIGGQFTPEEKAPGSEGVRAWLRGGNLIVAALIPLLAWEAYGTSFPLILLVTLGALLAYPLLNFAQGEPVVPPPAAPDVKKPGDSSPERERILKMVEEGKITAAESATLLAALHVPQHATAPGGAMTPARKLVCAGAALVLIGFFLPWFSYNVGREVRRGANQAIEQFGQMMPDLGGTLPVGEVPFNFHTPSIFMNGIEIPNGLGWLVLVLAVGVAALPFVAPAMARLAQRAVAFIALGAGAFAMIYLLSRDPRHANIGIALALAGYVLGFAGTMRERHA